MRLSQPPADSRATICALDMLDIVLTATQMHTDQHYAQARLGARADSGVCGAS